jgi:fermentation-respiration switch protein FrsA (DUF1100 family)
MKRLRDAGEARSREARGEPVRLVPVVPDSAASFTESTPQLYREGYDYYRTARAQHPNSPNRYMLSSLPLQMAFFPFEQLETISPRPLLVIAGSKADTLFWSREVYEKAREPRELHVIEGATHIDMYDRPQFVSRNKRRSSRLSPGGSGIPGTEKKEEPHESNRSRTLPLDGDCATGLCLTSAGHTTEGSRSSRCERHE